MVFINHAFSLKPLKYLIPLFLLTTPYLLRKRINIRFDIRDILAGVTASLIILLPLVLYQILSDRGSPILPSMDIIVLHLFLIAIPEEVYFRGVLQEVIGNNIRGVIVVSLLFSFSHLPWLIFYGDALSLLTFFPSLVMGYLYMRTSNILPSALFHFTANIIFLNYGG